MPVAGEYKAGGILLRLSHLGKIGAIAVSIVMAAVASAVYRAFVFAHFEPIRLEVVGSEVYSSGRVIPITLPELAPLRGQTAVLGVRLRNARSEARRIGLLGDGSPRSRAVLPAEGTMGWDIVLTPEMVQALDMEVGKGVPALELTGDANGWALTSLEVRNYHMRMGDRPMALVLPEGAAGYTLARGLLPVAMGLFFLALVNALGQTSPRRRLRLIGSALSLTAFFLCLACLILPGVSPFKVLLSPLAFSLIVTGLFAPVLLTQVPEFVARMPATFQRLAVIIGAVSGVLNRRFAIVARCWKRHEVTFERGAALLGLAAIAIAQPIFAVVSNSPEFFAARGTTAATAIGTVLAIALGIPLVLLGIERAIRAASRPAATVFHGILLALLSASVLMAWVRRSEVLVSPWDVLASLLVGAVVALAYTRSTIFRQFPTALSPAALVLPALFLLDPNVNQSFLPSESAAAVQTIDRTPPIVFVVFDELPLNSLLDAEGSIDAQRYPNFAALALDAYWFRGASTVAHTTTHAVPAILSGRYPGARNAVPTLRYYPVNLFTVLAGRYDILASLRFQKLCPPRACQDTIANPADTVDSLLSDLGLVWLHIVLPQQLTDGLPPVTEDWADFGQTRETPAGETRGGRSGLFARFVSSIDDRPARLHFIHAMVPHMPFEYVSSGRRYRGPDHGTRRYIETGLFERMSAAYADTVYQRHLAQVGFVDRLLGDLVLRLREVGVYDRALIIVTADHGASYREGRPRRLPQRQNLSDILRVPLLMKLPGQQRGEVVDGIVETVDILPTILDILGAESGLRFDGRSLVAAGVPARSSRTFFVRSRPYTASEQDLLADSASSLDRKERRFGRGNPTGLYAPSGARHLLGMNVSQSTSNASQDVQVTIRNPRQFEAVNLDRDLLPLYVGGVLETSRSDPLQVAVAVNGIVAAVTHSYRERGSHLFGTLIPEASLRNGKNTVAAFVVNEQPGVSLTSEVQTR
jgi:hypothetical protein